MSVRVLPPRCPACRQIVLEHCPNNEACPWVRCPVDGVRRRVGAHIPPTRKEQAK